MPKTNWINRSALAIRRATFSDLPDVLAIDQEQFSNPWTGENFQAELANSFSEFYVAEDPQYPSLAGFLIFWRLGEEVELHKIAVAQACQRRGYGSCLLEFFISIARSRNCRRALLEVRVSNEKAIRLYEKFSFQRLGRRRDYYSLPSEDALVFELKLQAE